VSERAAGARRPGASAPVLGRKVVLSRAETWAVSFEGGSWHGLLARLEARHDTKYFGLYRHDTNTRVMSCLESQHGGLHGPARILGRAWAGTTRKWHVDTSTTILPLI
jgi:hypothetical protein